MHIESTPLLILTLLASPAAVGGTSTPRRRSTPAPVVRPRGANINLIPERYIVKLEDDSASSSGVGHAAVVSLLASAKPESVYNMTGFRGFVGELSLESLEDLRHHPAVEYIEQDAVVEAYSFVTETDVPWGLDRVSHRARNPGGSETTYTYDDAGAGANTCTYVVDTGIYAQHVEFGGRASNLFDVTGEGPADGNGHGTHVAGIAGSAAYGVAKRTSLFGVKVLTSSGSGSTSGVIQGLNFVATDARTRAGCAGGAVANISLGGSYSAALNGAAAALVSSGVFVAVASGGGGDDASHYSPASEPTVCTVAASDELDRGTTYSNSGPLVDVYAPGSNVLSTWNTGPTATKVLSGTSMAAAYVSGLGAYLLALEGPRDGVALCERIKELATKDVLTSTPAGTANRLIFNGNPSG